MFRNSEVLTSTISVRVTSIIEKLFLNFSRKAKKERKINISSRELLVSMKEGMVEFNSEMQNSIA